MGPESTQALAKLVLWLLDSNDRYQPEGIVRLKRELAASIETSKQEGEDRKEVP